MRGVVALLAAIGMVATGADRGGAQGTAPIAILAPTGVLRVGLVEAPTDSPLFVRRTQDGHASGVTADLATDLARRIGIPMAATILPNTGAAVEAMQAGQVDVAFMPVDDTRRQVVDFGPDYFQIESTYLVSGASGITDVGQVNRPGLRVVAISGTTTFRASARTLTATQPQAVATVAEAVERMRAGQADAFALSRDTLGPILAQVPGSRIVQGCFQRTSVAVALPKGRPAALAFVGAWLQAAKASGQVRRIFDAHGFQSEAVAP